MIKNLLISGLLTKVMFSVSPYSFSGIDAVITGAAFFAAAMIIICETEETIKHHIGYKARRKFRQLIQMTTIR